MKFRLFSELICDCTAWRVIHHFRRPADGSLWPELTADHIDAEWKLKAETQRSTEATTIQTHWWCNWGKLMTTQSLSSPLNKSISLSISLSTAAGMSWDVQWEEDVRDIWQLWSFRGSQSYRSWWLDRNSIGSTKNSEFKKIFAAFQTYFERSCTMDEFKCSFPVSALTFVQLWVAGCARSA